MSLETEIRSELRNRGADFVQFADISHLSVEQNRQYPRAIIFGIALLPEFIQLVSGSSQIITDEFHETERKTDQLADHLADYLILKGHAACSQSEQNLAKTGSYNESTKSSALPHKTIAGMAGLGWIGKHNLLINPEFGSAISICTVLTDAPLLAITYPPAAVECGDCTICVDCCSLKLIKGKSWSLETHRDELLDVYRCNSCLKCLAACPWTQDYMNRKKTSK